MTPLLVDSNVGRLAGTDDSGRGGNCLPLRTLCVLCGFALVLLVWGGCLGEAPAPNRQAGKAAVASGPAGAATQAADSKAGSLVHGLPSEAGPGSAKEGPASRPPDPNDVANDPDVKLLVKGINEFAIDLYKEIAKKEKGNIFFSPFSISSALAMTYAGARGKTAEEMAKVLHFPEELTNGGGGRLHAASSKLTNRLNGGGALDSKNRSIQLSVANSLWIQKGFPFHPEYLRLTKSFYSGAAMEADFAGAGAESCRRICDWVSRETNGKIKDIVTKVDSSTRLVLANAIWFEGPWSKPFPKGATKKAPFFLWGDRKVEVPMMYQAGDFWRAQCPGFAALELPYRGDEYTMLVYLPASGSELTRLETLPSVQGFTRGWEREYLDVAFPKFKMDLFLDLGDRLKAMGIRELMTEGADLSGMSPGKGLSLSEAVHKAFVDVDEVGTRAAAATLLSIRDSIHSEFRADRPFAFMILDRATRVVLFVGRVADPSK